MSTKITADTITTLALEHGLEVKEQTGFYKIYKDQKAIYVAKNKGLLARVDFAGFELDHPVVRKLTEDDAKRMKLGKVRAQVFPKHVDNDEQVLEAINLAFTKLTDGSKGFKFLSGGRSPV